MSRLLEASGLEVVFPDFRLGPVDLVVDAGERVALVGANGAGKSTTLRAVSGRLNGYEGSVRVGGLEVRADRAGTRSRVGVLPERLLGLAWLTVREHLDLLADFHPTWDRAYATRLCDELELPVSKPLGHLSKGTRVKLSLVSAEAFRPPLLLLDEPTSGIDPLMRERLLEIVRRVVPRGGPRALVFSTHILEDVGALAERVVLLRRGRVVADQGVGELGAEGQGGGLTQAIRRRLADA